MIFKCKEAVNCDGIVNFSWFKIETVACSFDLTWDLGFDGTSQCKEWDQRDYVTHFDFKTPQIYLSPNPLLVYSANAKDSENADR